MSGKTALTGIEASASSSPDYFRPRFVLVFSGILIAFGIAEMVVGFFVFAYSDPRFGAWWAGLLSVLLGVCGLRVKTRCGGYLFASFSVVILIAYLVGMVLDGGMYGLMSTFEACREPLTADELADCVVLTSCGISDEYEAQAAICATGHDVECACVNDEDKCYEFKDVQSCPGLLDTYSELLFNSFMICLFGMIVGIFSSVTTFAKLCCCK